MKVCYGNQIKEIQNIVLSKAKYQKVMVLYGDCVSSVEIDKIYESIQGSCIFNKANINQCDVDEINNGYRIVIFLCSANEFINCKFNKEEFINIFLPQNNSLLPFYLTPNNTIANNENHLLLENRNLDFTMWASLIFNSFYSYLQNLLNGKSEVVNYEIFNRQITHNDLIDMIEKMPYETIFQDFDILNKQQIDYNDLIFVDLLLIEGLLLLVESIKEKRFTIVDVYKSARDDEQLIEKFYKLYNNDMLFNVVILNYNCIHNFCLKTKQKILELVCFFDFDKCKINSLIDKIRNYAKNSTGLTAYLYLYNIFDV